MEQNDHQAPKDPWTKAREMFPRVVDYIAQTDHDRAFWELIAGTVRAFSFIFLVRVTDACLFLLDSWLPGQSLYESEVGAFFVATFNKLGWITALVLFLLGAVRTVVLGARRRKRRRSTLKRS